MLRNRLISAGLEPFTSHTEESFNNFKIKILLIPVLLARTFGLKLVLILFFCFNIRRKTVYNTMRLKTITLSVIVSYCENVRIRGIDWLSKGVNCTITFMPQWHTLFLILFSTTVVPNLYSLCCLLQIIFDRLQRL